MNIFYLDKNIDNIAKYHCDKHIVKMPLETAQLLSTTCHFYGVPGPYRKTHVNHPAAVWARSSIHNFRWLHNLGKALCKEYTRRYNKTHKSEAVIDACLKLGESVRQLFPSSELSEPPQTMPEQYRGPDVVQAYRNFYIGEKSRFAKWKLGGAPRWFLEEIKNQT